jgi:hypothetical protein
LGLAHLGGSEYFPNSYPPISFIRDGFGEMNFMCNSVEANIFEFDSGCVCLSEIFRNFETLPAIHSENIQKFEFQIFEILKTRASNTFGGKNV